MLTLALGSAVFGILLAVAHYRATSIVTEFGTMSRQWLAEYNASHP